MMDQIRREVARGLAGARGAVRAVLQGISLAQRIQRVQAEALAGEQLQDVELMQQFGFTSAPPEGAQLIVLPLGGRTSAAVVVASEHGSYRLKLGAQGEMAIYNQWGDYVHMKADRSIHVKAAARLLVEAPLAEFTGNVTVTGDLQVNRNITATLDIKDAGGAKSMAGMRQAYNTHTHNDPQGGVVGAPNQAM